MKKDLGGVESKIRMSFEGRIVNLCCMYFGVIEKVDE